MASKNLDGTIPWAQFTANTQEYHNVLDAPLNAMGITPTTFVTFKIRPLVEYLGKLAAQGISSTDIYLSKYPNVAGSGDPDNNRLSIIFTGSGTSATMPANGLPFDIGEVHP